MISPCGGCDLQIVTLLVSWYCLVWDLIMIGLNCYGYFVQARKRKAMLEEQAANFIPMGGNTIDIGELQMIRQQFQIPRSRMWAITGLGLSSADLVFSIIFIQGVLGADADKILLWCVCHTSISYSAVILTILAIKCNIRADSRDRPVGFSVWNSLYLIVDLYWLWIGVSFYRGLQRGFGSFQVAEDKQRT